MALTNEEKQELLNAMKAESQSVDNLEVVTSLDGVKSLPAVRGEELVAAPLSLLGKPAQDAAAIANSAAATAYEAAGKANDAAEKAETFGEQAEKAAATATEAVGKANEAISAANTVAANYEHSAKLGLDGATARFAAIDETTGITTEISSLIATALDVVVWSVEKKTFLLRSKDKKYYTSWAADGGRSMALFLDGQTVKQDKVYACGESLYVYSDGDLVEISGSGGGNIYNVTSEAPLSDGYYTLQTAIAAVEAKQRRKGLCVTYETAQGKWETKQFVGTSLDSWEQATAWADFGGDGTVKSVTVNGVRQQPDAEGNVSVNFDKVEVDESLDTSSTNPVQNKAVAAKMAEVEASTVFGMTAEVSDDQSSVRLALTNKSGAEIASADIPAGSGGGGGESSTTKIVLSASVDHATVKEGGSVRLTYTYDHQNTGGDSTGQKATIQVIIKRGATTTYSDTIQDVGKGRYDVDLTKYLLLGTSDIYVIATSTDPNTGKAQKKQAYVSVKVVTLSLHSSYNLANALSKGGYGVSETVSIPYSVSGSGTKTIFLYVDGNQRSSESVTRSGTTNGSFDIPMSGLSMGRHNIQMVAEMDAGNGLTLKSESIYIDILKGGRNVPFVGLMMTNADGRIMTATEYAQPTIGVGQYEQCSLSFAAYDPTATPAELTISRNGSVVQTVSVARTTQHYENRFTDKGRQTMVFAVGQTAYTFYVDVAESSIDIGEATYGLSVKLSPSGRSNGESNPARWDSNGIRTSFEGFDWKSNGWTGDSLLLTNGAKAVIGCELFKTDAGITGKTIEMEFKVSNVSDRKAEVISCMSGGKGLSVTPVEASIKTGTILHYTNEDGEDASREIKIGTKFAPDVWLKVAFVIGKRADGRLMELYVNGNRAGADIYDSGYYFQQDTPVGITLDSDAADLEVRNIRIYDRALTDDEELENRMVDSTSADEMMELWSENDIIGETGNVDIDKLRAKGKGVMRIVRKGGLDEVNETNNKKTDFLADIYFYSPFGKQYDFVLHDCYIRIQGTSSTKYPSKNIRIYLSKGGSGLSFEVNGQPIEKKAYALRPGGIAMGLLCAKSDYSDSSMSLNTGGAKLFNEVMKELGLLTPPQRYQYEQAGKNMSAVTIRTAIDGFPIDIFSAETVDGESTYYGQYNLNNEKSKSGKLFGMEGLDGFTPDCPLTLETLNNGEKTCLFQSSSDEDLIANFDAGLETNVPDDVKWAGLNEAQQSALKRLFGWIRSCVPEGASADDLTTFKSEKFATEVEQYFNKDFLLTYYIYTDYAASVDQRAKNMLLRTWDGKIWYITYYDGDTQYGKRNDCFLAYDYTIDRDTYDAEASKYAFEGRESWLWNLVLANLQDDLRRCAANFRAKMTPDRVLSMLTVEQMGNWSDRAYNKSGYLKYIKPAMVETYGKKWPFIYALQGNNKAFLTYFIRNRYALLDAKYGTSSFTSDNIDLYMSRTSADTADTVRLTAGEVYAFGYGTNNSPNLANTGIVEAGKTATLEIKGAYTVNDPLRIYGASRMQTLDMSGAADHLKNGFDLGKCTALRELNMQSGTGGSTGWWLSIGTCQQLRTVNLRNQQQAKTGGSTSTELDFTTQPKLQYLDARGTQVKSISFAKGSPLTEAMLPGTLTVLRLEYLSKLTTDGLSLESYANVKTLIVDGCPNINWETLLARCSNVARLRVTGISKSDDGTWLSKFMSMGGIDADGNATETCALVGTVHLTHYMDEEEYAKYTAHFPELNIKQPEYTMIEFDDSVADDANVTNLDNGTGYASGITYKPNGHILKILSQRHRVLAKVTKKPTTTTINMAGQDITVNNPDGEMTYYPLDDENSRKYADGTEAKLDGSEGDWMMYEPFFWCKGINDYLNGKHYSCYSSNDREHEPERPVASVLTLEDIGAQESGILKGRKIMANKETLANSYTNDSSYSVCKVVVSGYKRVRFPSVPGTNLVGAVFVDSTGKVLSSVVVPTITNNFEPGMYIIKDIPDGATALHFTILNTAEFDKVVLSNSSRIEDMEPDWVADDEHLCAVVGSTAIGSKLRAVISGGSTTSNMTWTDFHYYSVQRGMQQIDAQMHSRIANLFYAKYGRRNAQEQCGAGSNTNMRTTGGTADMGMTDTIGYEEAKSVNANVTNSLIDNFVHQYAWYRSKDEYGGASVTQVNNICCLGYEDIYGHKYDMMDNVDLPNDNGNQGKWRIRMPDGTFRMVKGSTYNGMWIEAVAHGKYMDVIPVGNVSGSSSTYYGDIYWVSTSVSRVVYRGNSDAGSNGGVSNANANNDASFAYADVGSRLAFRGKIVKAQSVAAYKALIEVA